MDKLEAARRQLGTALQLYLDQRDPVSVHCLVCGGCELADSLAAERGQKPMRLFSLAQQTKMDEAAFYRLRNRFWNAFKHYKTLSGQVRQDDELLGSFTDAENRERLFLGWFDYASAGGALPIAAQVYNTWFMALDRSRFRSDEALSFLTELDKVFPGLAELPPDRQHQRLRREVEKARRDRELVNDTLTDRRPLILGPLA